MLVQKARVGCRWRHKPAGSAHIAAMLCATQVVFSAECNHLFDWHTIGIFYSFEVSGFSHVANLTRLLACNEPVRAHSLIK